MQVLCKAAEMSIPIDDNVKVEASNNDNTSSIAPTGSVEGAQPDPLVTSLKPKAPNSPTDNGTILYSLPARPAISDSRDITSSPNSIKRHREEEREQSSPISHNVSSFPPQKQARINEEAGSTVHSFAASATRPLPMYPPVIPEVVNLPLSRPAQKAGSNRKRGWVKKTWEERLEELKAYKKNHGDCNVPTLSKENPSLGKRPRVHTTSQLISFRSN